MACYVYEYQDMLEVFNIFMGNLAQRGVLLWISWHQAWEVMRARELGWGRLDERWHPTRVKLFIPTIVVILIKARI